MSKKLNKFEAVSANFVKVMSPKHELKFCTKGSNFFVKYGLKLDLKSALPLQDCLDRDPMMNY